MWPKNEHLNKTLHFILGRIKPLGGGIPKIKGLGQNDNI